MYEFYLIYQDDLGRYVYTRNGNVPRVHEPKEVADIVTHALGVRIKGLRLLPVDGIIQLVLPGTQREIFETDREEHGGAWTRM